MIQVQEYISLKDFTTFRIGGIARYLVIINDEAELKEAISFSKDKQTPFLILGGGSNVLLSDQDFSGLVIINKNEGIKLEGDKIIVNSGVSLDDFIIWSLGHNLSGLENLSGVPGSVGGAIYQNAGAYGVEIKDFVSSVSGINTKNNETFLFSNRDCQFDYRDSLFKRNKNLIITSVQFNLNKIFVPQIDYYGLNKLLGNIQDLSVNTVRENILKIRREKLPDWKKVGTAGSFFKNPIISIEKYKQLQKEFPNIPCFAEKEGKIKIPLAWVLDNICHLRGYQVNTVGLYDKQPLIVVNLKNATANEVINFSETIKNIVKEKTGIEIEEEVEKIN